MVGTNGSSDVYRRLTLVEARAEDNHSRLEQVADEVKEIRDLGIRNHELLLSIKEQARLYYEELHNQSKQIQETIKPFTYTSIPSARIVEGFHWTDKKMRTEDLVNNDRRKSLFTLFDRILWAGLTALGIILWDYMRVQVGG